MQGTLNSLVFLICKVQKQEKVEVFMAEGGVKNRPRGSLLPDQKI